MGSWPEGHTPGLVSRVFSLEGFFSLTCLGRPPAEHPRPGVRAAGSDPRPPSVASERPGPSPQDPWAEAGPASPDILGSPMRRMWGQCWSVLIRKGLVTPRTTFGLEREERERGSRGSGGPGQARPEAGGRLRGLRARRKLLELAVVDGEVRAIVAAELEGLQAAVGWAQQAVSTQGHPAPMLLPHAAWPTGSRPAPSPRTQRARAPGPAGAPQGA